MSTCMEAPTKAQAARSALLDCWRVYSDREIARLIGVSNRTVSKQRQQLETEGQILPRQTSTHSVKASLYEVCTSAVEPAALNDQLYDPIDETDPSFLALVDNIRERGILEPLVVSSDGYILSGHRRHAASCYLELERIPVRIQHDVSYLNNREEFLKLLASYNRQRVKTSPEQFREEIALMSSGSVQRVRNFRRDVAQVNHSSCVEVRDRKPRSVIRDKMELREAIIQVVESENNNWPLSDRAIHYRLLNFPDLVRNDKTRVPYRNDGASYNDVTDMLTRLRLDGSISYLAIADETRPVCIWDTHKCVGDFVRRECDEFLNGYYRQLLQSQPNWIELLVEKNTVATQLRGHSEKYTIPMTSGRGYSSLPPRKAMIDRFVQSGRENLIVIVISDFDPEGEDIPVSFGASLRDDFGVNPDRLQIIKGALTAEQVLTMNLHAGQFSKTTSSRYKRFVKEHGERCWELESLTVEQLREITESVIREVLDLDAFETEVLREQSDQRILAAKRREMQKVLTENINQE
ncbi:MAG TPA: hypothetical protein DD473_23060 [Planctomycetaceae bacterium]|nr:hypothetical protein [Planctomycetaceae bacterium]